MGEKDADLSQSMDQAKAILVALLFGDKYYLSTATVDNFASATLAHSLALSGQHLMVAGLLGMFAILFMARIYSKLYLFSAKAILIALASIPLALLYLWLGNAPASLLRAFAMLSIFAFWLWRGYNFTGTDLLAAAVLLILAYNPLAIYDIGLQLSVLCIAVLTITGPAFNRLMPKANNHAAFRKRVFYRILQILAVSLLIQVALLPISLLRFHMAGWWFPLNLVWLPLLGVIVLPLAAVGLIISLIPGLGSIAHFILIVASFPCYFITGLLALLRKWGLLTEPAFLLPHWSVLPAYALLLLGLGWLASTKINSNVLTKFPAIFTLILILLAVGPFLRIINYFDGNISLEALDVGQGQAILINYPGNGRLLIDGGGSHLDIFDYGKNVVGPYLSANRPPMLNAIINSHPDMDHVGGLFYLLDKFKVQKLFHNGKQALKGKQHKWLDLQKKHFSRTLRTGDIIYIGPKKLGLKLEVLYPERKTSSSLVGNDASLVLRLTYHDRGIALIPGDIGKKGITDMIYSNADLRSKIVLAPHHGSNHNFMKEFYMRSEPEIVLISCGYANIFRMPGDKLMSMLNEDHIPTYITADSGRIKIDIDRNGNLELSKCIK